MTDYAELRAALKAGPTPGPWLLDKFHPHITDAAQGSSRVLVCQVAINTRNDEGRKNEAYIAACHPEAIRALLAERDALREALDGLVGDIESLVAESDGVAGLHQNGDLATWAELMPGGRFEWLEHMDKARAALAQEQGEKHDNQD